MKLAAMLCILASSGILSGCNAIARKIASKQSDTASCDAFEKIGDPIRTADADFKSGERHFFSFGVYGYGAHLVAPGVDDPKFDWVNNVRDLQYVNDPTTGPADKKAADADYRITKCGQKWIDWAELYNKRLCTNMHEVGQASCEIHRLPDHPPY